ncbi:arginine repressor [Enterococcus canis]|uniref:Arginine repressor n=1 Tax=Enterococcus canis TaxID=214095 RepID=A0A1L8REL0_9ENTE|nr:arginine repressor [Enterococcus canis]OJG18220.1 arginine repressor [Enterococcus canis]
MKKASRQALIKQLITQQPIETQEELLAGLEAAGVKATQATISRDIREMGIVKTHGIDGKIQYALFTKTTQSSEQKLHETVKDTVTKVIRVQFIVVIHTTMGNADVVAALLDDIQYEEIAGTIAGVDTIVCIATSEGAAQIFEERITDML